MYQQCLQPYGNCIVPYAGHDDADRDIVVVVTEKLEKERDDKLRFDQWRYDGAERNKGAGAVDVKAATSRSLGIVSIWPVRIRIVNAAPVPPQTNKRPAAESISFNVARNLLYTTRAMIAGKRCRSSSASIP